MTGSKDPAPAPAAQATQHADIQKQDTLHEEHIGSAGRIDDPEKPGLLLDYSGAAAKTDPEEVRLVRKLDWRIMVRPPDTNTLLILTDLLQADAVVDVLAQLS